jgi:ATP-binding cassette, subfamily C, bacteriocin exporter
MSRRSACVRTRDQSDFGLLRQHLVAHVGRKVDLALIAGYTRRILRITLRFVELRQVGEILSRVNDAAKVREAISGTTLTAVVDGTLVVLTLMVDLMCQSRS